MTSYVRCATTVSLAGMVWADSDTLAILRSDKIDNKTVRTISFVKADGVVHRTISLPEMDTEKETDTGQLAFSPDGRCLVVTFQKASYFLDAAGTVLGIHKNTADEMLAQPTFTADSTQVAFKFMRRAEGQDSQVEAIVFYSRDGRELRCVSVMGVAMQASPGEGAPAKPPAPPTNVPPTLLPPAGTLRPPTGPHLPVVPPQTQPTSAPALNPDQQKDLEELRPELP